MMPMPPTSSDTAAMLASSVVSVLVPSCCALAISARLRIEKSSSVASGRLWRSRSSAVICRWRASTSRPPNARWTMIVPVQVLLEAALDLRHERRRRDEHAVVVVLTHRRLALARAARPRPGTGCCGCAPSGRSGRRRGRTACRRRSGRAPRPWSRRRCRTAAERRPRRGRPAAHEEVVGRGAGDAGRPVRLLGDDLARSCASAAPRTGSTAPRAGWRRDRPRSASACDPKPPCAPPAVVVPDITTRRFDPIAA